ncbi:MAG TPA: hypothetical protein VGE53_00175 [Candidatus Paceibacterota bacterium]
MRAYLQIIADLSEPEQDSLLAGFLKEFPGFSLHPVPGSSVSPGSIICTLTDVRDENLTRSVADFLWQQVSSRNVSRVKVRNELLPERDELRLAA